MKTLITLTLAASALVPFAACSSKTIVQERPAAEQPVVRENNTIIKEKSPTVTEREREVQY